MRGLKDAAKILLYFLGVVLLAAALAPLLFWAVQFAAAHDFLRSIAKADFHAYFDRAALVAALALLYPLARSLNIRSMRDFGLHRNPRWLLDLVAGLLVALASSSLLEIAAARCGAFHWPGAKMARLLPALPVAIIVSLIEEPLFRGAMQGVIQRSASKRAAWLIVGALFAVIHFLKPPSGAIPPDQVRAWSGFLLLPLAAWQFADPAAVVGGLSTLFCVSLALGYARWKTASLWMPFGLHAGWILGNAALRAGWVKPSRRAEWTTLWFAGEPLSGLAALCAVALAAAALWLLLRSRAPEPNASGNQPAHARSS